MPVALAPPPRTTTPDLETLRRFLREGRPGPHWYAALLGLDLFEFDALRARVEKGFSYRTLERLQKNLDLPMHELAELVLISPRTLARRKQEGKLLPEESDRLLRIARVFGRALELFDGDASGAGEWLEAKQPALGGGVPLALARTELGSREVELLIERLEHGVFS
ncbi:MAG TPA: antitoxin Xre-like helix-turn-helix domain-containing protein [Thermoanaerobaculia bacterium]|nr:antitoxin Xre-like helix-turn-helix domain-containing protein [Thermoanaerobaculia bacterium]